MLIPTINFTEFKKLKVEQLRRLKSSEVTFNGEYLFTFINPQTDYIRVQSEYDAQMSNAVKGETLEEVKELVEV